jgi:hypothetical protein
MDFVIKHHSVSLVTLWGMLPALANAKAANEGVIVGSTIVKVWGIPNDNRVHRRDFNSDWCVNGSVLYGRDVGSLNEIQL